MRTYFRSLTRPKHVAERLHLLLPALSYAEALDWSAKVFGYRDWFELQKLTKAGESEPTPEISHPHVKGDGPVITTAFVEELLPQKIVFAKLLADQRFLGELLYDTWLPFKGGTSKERKIASFGKGCPAFQLVQYDLLDKEVPGCLFSEGDDGLRVVAALPVNLDETSLLREFLAKLQADGNHPRLKSLRDALNNRAHQNVTFAELDIEDGPEHALGKQRRSTLLYALNAEDRLVGCVVFRYEFFAWQEENRLHSMEILLEDAAVLQEYDDVIGTLGQGASCLFETPVSRYLWSRVHNSDKNLHLIFKCDSEWPGAHEIADYLAEYLTDSLQISAFRAHPALDGIEIRHEYGEF